ncbi:MAG: hypothetical protein FJ224_04075 [Lentisphaerae bacterium]|nr:hypothetical protein [Lentisphaerota bacterium]
MKSLTHTSDCTVLKSKSMPALFYMNMKVYEVTPLEPNDRSDAAEHAMSIWCAVHQVNALSFPGNPSKS